MNNLNLTAGQKLKIRKLEENLNQGKFSQEVLEALVEIKYIQEGRFEEYKKSKDIVTKFQKNLEVRFSKDLLINRILNFIKQQTGGVLTSKELEIKKQIEISIERQMMIISSLIQQKDMTNTSQEEKNLYKYLIINFHRTLCEITPKFFYPNLGHMIDFLIKEYEAEKSKKIGTNREEEINEKLKNLKKWKEDIDSGSLGLDSLRVILSSYENKTEDMGITQVYESSLGYLPFDNKNPGEESGFVLRNQIAHERRLFNEIDLDNEIIPAMEKVQMFNIALIFGLYLDLLKVYQDVAIWDTKALSVSLKPFFDLAKKRF